MKFTAAGDMIIGRRIQKDFEGFSEIAPFIMQGDARFFNLETTLNHEGECPSSQLSGGTYLRTNPEVLEDIKEFGFNMTSFNNNHALDFSFEGLLRTLEALNKSGLVHAGVGKNLAEAAAPKYLDTKNGRVALISVNTTFDEYMLAGEQTPRILGRPGINGVRTDTKIVVSREDIDCIKKIAAKTGINAYNDIIRKEGYLTELAEIEVKTVGIRPCGSGYDEEKLKEMGDKVKAISEKHSSLPCRADSGSTDCNIPMSMGIPAICVGSYIGAKWHTREEKILISSIPVGLKIAAELILGYFE